MSRHTQDKFWKDFVHWCSNRKLRPLPAHPWTIAAYLRWLDSRGQGEIAEKVIKSISRSHILYAQRSPHDHPVIVRTMVSIMRRRSSAPDRSNLFDGKDFLSAEPVDSEMEEVGNEVDEDEDDDQDQAPETEVQILRRGFAMRSTPKLVRRKPRRSNKAL